MQFSQGARGPIVVEIQSAIGATPDGEFGPKTAERLMTQQRVKGVTPTGILTEANWVQTLPTVPFPDTGMLCLNLTAGFEGHGWGCPRGDWDGAGVTWGIIGFTLASGSLGAVLRQLPAGKGVEVFGEDFWKRLTAACALPSREAREDWGRSISDPDTTRDSKGRKFVYLLPEWEERFEAFALLPEVRVAQKQVAAANYFRGAMSRLDAARGMGLIGDDDPRNVAFFFDTQVQQGGVTDNHLSTWRHTKGGLLRLAEIVASTAKAAFRDDVFSRRRTIALGSGKVHGDSYSLKAQGF